jgi:hypothetical protein
LLARTSVSAWSLTGHTGIGDIAKERLTPKAQSKRSELIAFKVPPEKVKLGKVW